ncbi:calcium/sodium antiporter [Leeuwenhoekiella aequorea]|uniref:Cation:H+ antiporter n=1 Tax=Leeuwenhoekiella aequorea TaxID=283736 RepID=A0A4Q0P7B9_9FLAO|nr:calcium/sodium antiporter [Leeuwenhoekiella aequorea]RXG22583.1 cation:H+ antiporter [Leeuwenhoekiella aequorea]|tara:strand:+ start:128 stop:1081 length:954 start_codon:yes stop_codon:yes gene_type:complete
MSIVFILLGLTLLVIGGEFLVRASVGLSFKLNLSKMVIGLTVVSFATSAPELLVSLQAALEGYSDIALGNVIGSNIANIGLVLGLTAIISTLGIDRDFFRFNWPVMVLYSLGLYLALVNDNQISRLEGVVLLASLVIYLIVLIRRAKNAKPTEEGQNDEIDAGLSTTSYFKITVWLLIGALALYFGSEWLVRGAKDLAEMAGVSDYAISVTVIAIGTSVPELAASIIAALKKEKAISLGNLIGSNIFNIASVLGLTALITPIQVIDPQILDTNMFWLLGFALLLLPLGLLPLKLELNRWKGFILFAAYCVFIGMAFS